MLLSIDTSAGTSVAITGGRMIVERSVHDTRRHAEVIGALIAECLDAARVPARELAGVAVGMGPGPFTGLRVGIAAANTFAFGLGLPVHRVVSHDAIAFERYAAGESAPILVTTDARRHERYWSAYSGATALGVPIRAHSPGLDRPEELVTQVTGYEGYLRVDAEWVSAASIGALAWKLIETGQRFAGPEPLYLRSPDVTLAAAPKRVSS